jgi:hypothetical protein
VVGGVGLLGVSLLGGMAPGMETMWLSVARDQMP